MIILIIGNFLVCPTSSRADEIAPALPEDNLLYPVILGLDTGGTGSGFYLNTASSVYFVTSRHVLTKPGGIIAKNAFQNISNSDAIFDWLVQKHYLDKISQTEGSFKVDLYAIRDELKRNYPDEFPRIWTVLRQFYKWSLNGKIAVLKSYSDKYDKDSILLQINLEELEKNGLINYCETEDVAIVKIASGGLNKKLILSQGVIGRKTSPGDVQLIGLDINNITKFDDISIGNDVFIFGYPTSLQNPSLGVDFTKPLLRKGTVAGKDSSSKKIILNASIYFGDSGGLVIETGQDKSDPFQRRYKGIGIVQGMVPFVNEFRNQQYGYSNYEVENSGYSLAIPMDSLLQLIGKLEKK